MRTKQANQKRLHDAHSKFRLFEVGQSVLVRNLREGPKWLTGTVLEQTGPVSYRVQVSDQIWRRHTDQLLDHSVAVEDRSPDVAVQRGNLEILPSLPEPVPVKTSEPEMLPEQSNSQEHTETEFDSNTSDSTIVSTRYIIYMVCIVARDLCVGKYGFNHGLDFIESKAFSIMPRIGLWIWIFMSPSFLVEQVKGSDQGFFA